MSNLVQDQRVINHLERPKSEDFNLAQSLTAQTQQVLTSALYTGGAAWQPASNIVAGGLYTVVDGVRSLRVTADLDVASSSVTLLPGMQIQLGSTITDADGIQGVSQLVTRQLVTCSSARTLTMPEAPLGIGDQRIDLICINAFSALTENEPTDIFNTSLRTFGAPISKPKTFRHDLADEVAAPFQVVSYADIASATAPIVCVTGQQVSGTYPLDAPIPAVPSGYSALASVHRRRAIGIRQKNIVDYRLITAPGGNRNALFMRAAIGTISGNKGGVAEFSIVNGGYNAPYFAILRGSSSTDSRQSFSVDIFTNAISTGALSATIVQGPISDDNTTPLIFPVESFDPTNEVTDAYFDNLTASRYPYDVDELKKYIAIGQRYMTIRFSMAGLVVPAGSTLPKLDKTLETFGENPSGGTYSTVPVYIRVDWTPFVTFFSS